MDLAQNIYILLKQVIIHGSKHAKEKEWEKLDFFCRKGGSIRIGFEYAVFKTRSGKITVQSPNNFISSEPIRGHPCQFRSISYL